MLRDLIANYVADSVNKLGGVAPTVLFVSAVVAGVVLMAVGLTFVFYVVHVRFWVVPLQDATGKLTLLFAAQTLGWLEEQLFEHFVHYFLDQSTVRIG